ncbi:hypothetical protein QL285_051599 [Trifolium repens]|nr:hypothetical protein QL285_051599 [Trifolium repens]
MGTLEFEYDPEPERTFQRRLRANRLAKEQAKAIKTETMEGQQPRITMGDYCRRTDNDQFSLWFQPANPADYGLSSVPVCRRVIIHTLLSRMSSYPHGSCQSFVSVI